MATLTIYPNPATDNLTINLGEFTLGDKMNIVVEIIDINGKIISKHANLTDIENKIPIQTLKKGIYLVHIKGNNLNIYRKFVKE